MKELYKLLEVKLSFASVEHAQVIGVIECSHSSMTNYLNLYDQNETRNWHKDVDSAVSFSCNISKTVGSSPSLLFHERQPRTPSDLRFQNRELKGMTIVYDFTTQVQDDLNKRFAYVKDSILKAYHQCRHHFDQKTVAHPLKKDSFCLLLNPKIVKASYAITKSTLKWLQLYQVNQVLTNSNHVVRKVGMNYTQCVHRIRLRSIEPKFEFKDLEVVDANNFTPDPVTFNHLEPSLFDNLWNKFCSRLKLGTAKK